MRFMISSVHDFDSHFQSLEAFVPCDRETVDMVIEASAAMCENELAPLREGADRVGCIWAPTTSATRA